MLEVKLFQEDLAQQATRQLHGLPSRESKEHEETTFWDDQADGGHQSGRYGVKKLN